MRKLLLFSFVLLSTFFFSTSYAFADNIPTGTFDDPATCGYSATPGSLDGLYGWACDPTQPNTPLRVDIYADSTGDWGKGGYLVAQVTANISGEAGVASACGGNANHRFAAQIPDYAGSYHLRDGNPHTYHAFAISSPNGNNNFELYKSPKKNIVCGSLPTATPAAPTPTPTPVAPQPAVASVAVQLDSINANDPSTPNHPTRHLTIYLYKDDSYKNDPTGDKAVIKGGSTDDITFTKGDPNNQPASYGTYTNASFPLGNIVPGQYYVFGKTEGSLREPFSGTPSLVSLDVSPAASTKNSLVFSNKLPDG